MKRSMPPDGYADSAITSVEDPDAPAPRRIPETTLREQIAALLLLLALLGFGVGQWWDDQSRLDHYRAGTTAAAAQDWDAAAWEFSAAQGYGDAEQRLAVARGNAATRDSRYALASAARDRGDWVGALQALQPLHTLAPHYRDVEALERQALLRAGTAALSGTVALRLQADPPGLYRFVGDGWRPLPSGDRTSRVRATCPGGGVLYDGPAAQPPPQADGASVTAAWPRPGRVLQVDLPRGSPAVRIVVDLHPAARYVCTATGVWTLRVLTPPRPVFLGGPRIWSAAYQDFAATLPLTPTLPGPEWYIVAVAPEGDALLLLDGTGGAEAEQIRLYRARRDGSDPRPLLDQPGGLAWAELSPDGRYALLALHGASDPGRDLIYTMSTEGYSILHGLHGVGGSGRELVYSLQLLDLGANDSPQALSIINTLVSSYAVLEQSFGLFLRQPAHTGQVLLTWLAGDQQMIRLLDPRRPDPLLLETRLGTRGEGLNSVVTDLISGSLLLVAVPGDPAQDTVRTVLEITPRNQAQPLPVVITSAGSLRVRDGHLLILNTAQTSSGPDHFSLLSGRRPAAGTVPVALREIYSDSGRIAGDPTVPFRLAPNWVVYSDRDGALHGRSYDGTLDLRLPWDATGFSTVELVEPP